VSIFDGRLVQWSEVQSIKPEFLGSNPGVIGVFVMNNYTCSLVMAVYYYYQYNLYYDLSMFIRYLVSVTQVLKDT
jgi:hypothetical protein